MQIKHFVILDPFFYFSNLRDRSLGAYLYFFLKDL